MTWRDRHPSEELRQASRALWREVVRLLRLEEIVGWLAWRLGPRCACAHCPAPATEPSGFCFRCWTSNPSWCPFADEDSPVPPFPAGR